MNAHRNWLPVAKTTSLVRLAGALLLLAASMPPLPARAAIAPGGDPHAVHEVPVRAANRILADYTVPELRLVREDGREVSLRTEVDDGRPVVLAFIYTSCTTVCPVVSHVLAELQARLGRARDQVHLVSITIDPEYDTPARLHAYAQRFGAGPEWQHYTGTPAAIRDAQRAFDVYRGDKMDHAPALLVRPMPGTRWVRIDGFATPDQLLAELPSYCTAQ
jgi:protein SCO1/2